MLIYWEQSASGVQVVNFDTKEDKEECEIQKPHMKNVKNKEQITNPMVNTIFIFDLQMNNNYKCVGFGMQRSKDDMSGISIESIIIFAWSLGVLTQSSKLWTQSAKKFVKSLDVLS